MKRIAAAFIAALIVTLPSYTPAFAGERPSLIEPGVQGWFRAFCKSQSVAENMARTMMITGNYEMAQEILSAKVKEGECVIAPSMVLAPVDEVGEKLLPFVDDHGDLIEARAVRVGPYWSVVLAEGPKT